MFTGRRAFEDGNRRTLPPNPSSLVRDLDPAVERVIQRCMEEDPRNRPGSALSIAIALPGGDRLAAALAAGETPSPELVAAAGGSAGIALRTAVLCFLGILAGLAGVLATGTRANLLRQMPFEKSGAELAAKSRELIRQFGYTRKPADTAQAFGYDTPYLRYAWQQESLAAFHAQFARAQPAAVFFWYREHPGYLWSADGIITEGDPPMSRYGAIDVNLDPEGRLTYFIANPPRVDEPDTKPRAIDTAALFAAAGLDPARFTPATPRRTNATYF